MRERGRGEKNKKGRTLHNTVTAPPSTRGDANSLRSRHRSPSLFSLLSALLRSAPSVRCINLHPPLPQDDPSAWKTGHLQQARFAPQRPTKLNSIIRPPPHHLLQFISPMICPPFPCRFRFPCLKIPQNLLFLWFPILHKWKAYPFHSLSLPAEEARSLQGKFKKETKKRGKKGRRRRRRRSSRLWVLAYPKSLFFDRAALFPQLLLINGVERQQSSAVSRLGHPHCSFKNRPSGEPSLSCSLDFCLSRSPGHSHWFFSLSKSEIGSRACDPDDNTASLWWI